MPAKSRQRPRGFILLFALLILVAVVAIATVLANAVFSGIGISRNLNDAILAYFGAETGVERALYAVTRERRSADPQRADAIATINGLAPTGSPGSLPTARASYTVNQEALTELRTNVKQNQTVTFDLFNPDNIQAGLEVESLAIAGQDGGQIPAVGAWMQVSVDEFDPVSGVVTPTTYIEEQPGVAASELLATANCPTVSPPTCVINGLVAAKKYRVRVKALYDDVVNLTVKGFASDNAGGVEKEFMGQILVKGVGSYPAGASNPAQQALTVRVNWLVPSSPLFDYTLFSEHAIEKR